MTPTPGDIFSANRKSPHSPSSQVEVLRIKETWPDCRDGVEPPAVLYAWVTQQNGKPWYGRPLEGSCPLSQWNEWTFVRSTHD